MKIEKRIYKQLSAWLASYKELIVDYNQLEKWEYYKVSRFQKKSFWKDRKDQRKKELSNLIVLIMEVYSVKKLNEKYRSSENTNFL